jgi:arginine-tRNA-protein transferase
MHSLVVYTPPPSPCGYLPDRQWQIAYEVVGAVTPAEYCDRLKAGWRRFGFSLFRPRCPSCRACQSLRIPVPTFRPDRSQRRAVAANDGEVTLVIGEPGVTAAKLDLYDRFHQFQHEHKGWPDRGPEDPAGYADSFVENPFPTEEWRYYLGDKLVGVGYVDALPEGLSAIYFYHDPGERDRSLGTYNVLRVVREAGRRKLPHVYLGYYVAGCRSLEYKARYRPNEVLADDGTWQPFLT